MREKKQQQRENTRKKEEYTKYRMIGWMKARDTVESCLRDDLGDGVGMLKGFTHLPWDLGLGKWGS